MTSSDIVSLRQTYNLPCCKKNGENGEKKGRRDYGCKWARGGIVMISFLDSSSDGGTVLLANHWSRAWQSSSLFSGSPMSPSGPSLLQRTRYCVFFPRRLSLTILSKKNSFCPLIKIGSGGERAREGKSVSLFSLKGLISEVCRECHGLPWGFSGQPVPVSIRTRTHTQGYGF